MKLKRKYKLLILLLAIFILSVNGYSQDESHPPLIYQLSPPPSNTNPDIPDGSILIGIRPKGTVELRDPLGRRLIHRPKAKDIIEIPGAYYDEESCGEDEPFTSNIYIESPIGGHYEFKIFTVTDKTYIFYVIVADSKCERHDKVTVIDVPFPKGHPQTYDIQFDKKNWKVKAKRR